jgi:hypothetical protein
VTEDLCTKKLAGAALARYAQAKLLDVLQMRFERF